MNITASVSMDIRRYWMSQGAGLVACGKGRGSTLRSMHGFLDHSRRIPTSEIPAAIVAYVSKL